MPQILHRTDAKIDTCFSFLLMYQLKLKQFNYVVLELNVTVSCRNMHLAIDERCKIAVENSKFLARSLNCRIQNFNQRAVYPEGIF
jgi:hypothetical protein